MLIAKRKTKRSTYILNSDVAYQHALDKGHEVFIVRHTRKMRMNLVW